MNSCATLRRHLFLIRQVQPPYTYPAKSLLVQRLREQGLDAAPRTVERDLRAIGDEYGLFVGYHRTRQGYFLNLPTDEDVSDFQEFVRLLERRERLEFVTRSVCGAHDVSRYLQLERNDHFRGMEHLPLLWEMLRSERILQE
jgi:proteasome accessory factor B